MKNLIRVLFALIFASLVQTAQAGCSASVAGDFSFGTITVASSTPVGQILGTTKMSVTYNCTESGTSYTSGQSFYNDWSFQLNAFSNNGRMYGNDWVLPTNLPGVGIAFKELISNQSLEGEICWNSPRYGEPCGVLPAGRCRMPGSCQLSIEAKLVKTGNISGGTASGKALDFNYYAYGVTNGMSTGSNVSYSGKVQLATCKTSNVTVPLGNLAIGKMGPVGSTGPATQFNVEVTDCPAGISSMAATFVPTTSVLATGPSDFAINTSSASARGVGIRLSDANGPVPLNRERAIPYTGNSTNVTYKMNAAIVRAEEKVSPGSVNAALTVTMTYR